MSGEGLKYTCARCGKEFVSDWSDEEAAAESEALFGKRTAEELCVVCDVCWKELVGDPPPAAN